MRLIADMRLFNESSMLETRAQRCHIQLWVLRVLQKGSLSIKCATSFGLPLADTSLSSNYVYLVAFLDQKLMNKVILLENRPVGKLTLGDFKFLEEENAKT